MGPLPAALERFGPVSTMIERDDDIPPLADMLVELDHARALAERALGVETRGSPHGGLMRSRPHANNGGVVEAQGLPGQVPARDSRGRRRCPRRHPDGPHETKENLLGIYRDAYVLRLIDVIGADHERLHTYLGDDSFRAMARAYIATNPSRHRNARWFAQRLPEFLRSHEPYAKQPVLSELAALERALNDAFDGADAPVVTMADLAALPPEIWAAYRSMPATLRRGASRFQPTSARSGRRSRRATSRLPCMDRRHRVISSSGGTR